MAKVDTAFIKPFVEGTKETLKTLCEFTAVPGKPFLKKNSPPPNVDIAGVIGLASKTFSGSITIAFPEQVFVKIMSKMLGENYTEINKEIEDGAAELLNIIFGHGKRVLNATGHQIEKAIPTIVRGKSLQLTSMTKAEVVVLPFEIEVGIFYIEVAIDEGVKSE